MKKSKSVRLPQASSSDADADREAGAGAAPQPQPPITSLKKSKSVRVKSTLKAITNPVKSRENKKATKNDLELKEKEEAAKNVDDFLTSGRFVSPKPISKSIPHADNLSPTIRQFYEKQSSHP